MSPRLAGKVTVINGGASGIGAATVNRFIAKVRRWSLPTCRPTTVQLWPTATAIMQCSSAPMSASRISVKSIWFITLTRPSVLARGDPGQDSSSPVATRCWRCQVAMTHGPSFVCRSQLSTSSAASRANISSSSRADSLARSRIFSSSSCTWWCSSSLR